MTVIEVIKKAMKEDGLTDQQIDGLLKTVGTMKERLALLEIPPGEEDSFARLITASKSLPIEYGDIKLMSMILMQDRIHAYNRDKQRQN